jgi:hypothetical protein
VTKAVGIGSGGRVGMIARCEIQYRLVTANGAWTWGCAKADNRSVPPQPETGQVYRLVSRATGFSLGGMQDIRTHPPPIPQAKTVFAMAGDGVTPIENISIDTEFSTRWVLEPSDKGVRLRHGKTGLMLDSNLERQVYLLESNDGSFQQWELLDGDDENHWSLLNVATGFALDGNLDRDIFTMGRNDGAFQRWRFERVGPLQEMSQPPVQPIEVVAPFHPGTFGPASHD